MKDDIKKKIDNLCQRLKVCAGWPTMVRFFSGFKTMKLAEALALGGDRGIYLVRMMELPILLQEALITVLRCLGAYICNYCVIFAFFIGNIYWLLLQNLT